MTHDEIIDICQRQEEALVFSSFTSDDAWTLGCLIREAVQKEHGSAVVDISIFGIRMFACAVGSPTPHNETWITRKRNTCLEFWESSLRVTHELERMGKTLQQRGLSEQSNALSGGAFPIRLKDEGVIGAAVCSGLPQLHDHQNIADAMAKMLSVKIPSVLPENS